MIFTCTNCGHKADFDLEYKPAGVCCICCQVKGCWRWVEGGVPYTSGVIGEKCSCHKLYPDPKPGMIAERMGTCEHCGRQLHKEADPTRNTTKKKRGEILKEAFELINGDRQREHGSFENNVNNMKRFMDTFMGIEHTDHHIHCFYLALKMCRITPTKMGKDTLKDTIGYCGLIDDNQERVKNAKAD